MVAEGKPAARPERQFIRPKRCRIDGIPHRHVRARQVPDRSLALQIVAIGVWVSQWY